MKPGTLLLALALCQPVAMAAASQSPAAPAEIAYLPVVGCTIEPSVRIDVSSPVEGVLDRRPVKLGQSVKKGQLLFSLRSDVEKAAVELAKVRAEFTQRNFERNEQLYREDLISIHDLDEFQTEHQVAVKELQQAEAVLGQRSVKSPVNGVVVDFFVEQGEFVGTGPLLALAALDPLKVEIVMPYESLGSVKPDSTLKVYPVKPVGGEYPAKVIMIDPVIDAAGGTYRIRAHIANPARKLPAGIECKVSG